MADSTTTGELSGRSPKSNIGQKVFWVAMVTSILTGVGLIASYGLSWGIASIIAGVTIATSVISACALKVYDLLKDLKMRVSKSADRVKKTSKNLDRRLEILLELKEAILKTNERLYDILGDLSNIVKTIDSKVESIDEIFDALKDVLEQATKAISGIEKSVSSLSATASESLKATLGQLNLALKELQQEYAELARKAQNGVQTAESEVVDFMKRLDGTLSKVDAALSKIEQAAQGGSDLLAPFRALGNLIRNIKEKIRGIGGNKEVSSDSEEETEEYTDRVGEFYYDPVLFSNAKDANQEKVLDLTAKANLQLTMEPWDKSRLSAKF